MTVNIDIRRFSSTDDDFDDKLKALLAFETAQDDSVDEVVANIPVSYTHLTLPTILRV